MNLNEAKDEPDVALGTFLANQLPTRILFDLVADHSFISHEFVRKLSLSPHILNSPVMVEVVDGMNVSASNKLDNITINLNGNKFHKALLPFEVKVFDVILGMD